MKYTLTWNSREPAFDAKDNGYSVWLEAMKTEDFDEGTRITKATRTNVTAFLPATKPDNLGYLKIGGVHLTSVDFR